MIETSKTIINFIKNIAVLQIFSYVLNVLNLCFVISEHAGKRLRRILINYNKMIMTVEKLQILNECQIFIMQIYLYRFWMHLFLFCYKWICWSERTPVARASQQVLHLRKKNDCWHDNILLQTYPCYVSIITGTQAESLEDPPHLLSDDGGGGNSLFKRFQYSYAKKILLKWMTIYYAFSLSGGCTLRSTANS